VTRKTKIKLVLVYLGLVAIACAVMGALFLVDVIHGPRWLGITLVAGGGVGIVGYFDLGRTFQVR
jgi:hypothetical protein